MTQIKQRLYELGISLPAPTSPVGNYVPAKHSGLHVFVSGHGPFVDEVVKYKGRVGVDFSLSEAQAAAQLTLLNIFATLENELGDLDNVEGVDRLFVMVQAAPDFREHHVVANGASNLLTKVFGYSRGRHTRSAVGMASLPFDIAVEIEATVSLRL